MLKSHRFQSLAQRDINKETYVEPWPEAGLVVADSPADPRPSLRLAGGQVVELDRRARAEILALYSYLRPGRATQAQLLAMADALEAQYHVPECARLVREAAAVYLARGLFRK